MGDCFRRDVSVAESLPEVVVHQDGTGHERVGCRPKSHPRRSEEERHSQESHGQQGRGHRTERGSPVKQQDDGAVEEWEQEADQDSCKDGGSLAHQGVVSNR